MGKGCLEVGEGCVIITRGSGSTLNDLGVLVRRCGCGMGREEKV